MTARISATSYDVLPIVGMHRSGTSLCARICLEALGVHLGRELLPGRPDNPDGFFEDRDLVQIHRRLMRRLGPQWAFEQSVEPMPDGWWCRLDLQPEIARLEDWLTRLLDTSGPRIAGFKDPRTARLLPAWNEVFRRLQIRPRYLLCVRHPLAVVQSLHTRNVIPPVRAELMWLQHMVSAIVHTREQPVLIVRYERWFDDAGGQLQEVLAFLDVGVSDLHCVHDIVDRRKDHSSEATGALTFDLTSSLYDALMDPSVHLDSELLQGIADQFRNREHELWRHATVM